MENIFNGVSNAVTDIGTSIGNVASVATKMVGDNMKKIIIQKPPQEIAQEQLDFYNEQNLDKFCEMFSSDVVVSNYHGQQNVEGKDAFKQVYQKMFNDHPKNRAELVHRIVIRNKVIDHEKIYREGGDLHTFECVAIYTIEHGYISRVDFIK